LTSKRFILPLLMTVALAGLCADALAVQRFPPPDFESGHKLPEMGQPDPKPQALTLVAVVALVVALSVAAWLSLRRRSRRGIAILSVVCLLYFGFYRGGCVCPIGAIQNVVRALFDSTYVLPLTVIAFFVLPLLFALFFGRVFCGGVCPLGAIQDVVLIKPLRVPGWLQQILNLVPYFYLGLAVLFSANGALFVVCRYDPFVSFFRLSGAVHMLLIGAAFLIVGTVVGRPYCRFLCPYGALLNIVSRAARRRASITPDDCVVCGLCEESCPFDAIQVADAEGGMDE